MHNDLSGKGNFNSHAHVERDIGEKIGIFMGENFNSHAHVERDEDADDEEDEEEISTHTLTWSVTIAAAARQGISLISTHTLTWSVTKGFIDELYKYKFQLTRSRGALQPRQEIHKKQRPFQLTRSRGA